MNALVGVLIFVAGMIALLVADHFNRPKGAQPLASKFFEVVGGLIGMVVLLAILATVALVLLKVAGWAWS